MHDEIIKCVLYVVLKYNVMSYTGYLCWSGELLLFKPTGFQQKRNILVKSL